MKVEIGHLAMGQRELKSEIKDLGHRMDKDMKDLGKGLGNKIDRVLYGIITGIIGWMIKGGYDIYDERKERKKLEAILHSNIHQKQ
jgi:hypothetical protein